MPKKTSMSWFSNYLLSCSQCDLGQRNLQTKYWTEVLSLMEKHKKKKTKKKTVGGGKQH